MKAEILCLYDEGSLVNTGLIGAQGLSISIDIDGDRTLFDAGLRGRYLIHNMEELDYNPESVSRFVISHAHKSNARGLDGYLEKREGKVKVYSNSQFLGMKNLIGQSIFSDESAGKIDFERIDSDFDINEYLTIIGPFGPLDELFLVLKTKTGPVLFGSCFHCGLEPVFSHVKQITGQDPKCLIGGIHLPKAKPKDVAPVCDVLRKYNLPTLYLDHCAGPSGVMYIKAEFSISSVNEFLVGTRLTFDL